MSDPSPLSVYVLSGMTAVDMVHVAERRPLTTFYDLTDETDETQTRHSWLDAVHRIHQVQLCGGGNVPTCVIVSQLCPCLDGDGPDPTREDVMCLHHADSTVTPR